MSDTWSPTLVDRDGREIQAHEFAGETIDRPDPGPSIHANVLEKRLHPPSAPELTDGGRDAYQCPDCRKVHDTEEWEADCMRSHARREADKLQQWADEGRDVLPLGEVGR